MNQGTDITSILEGLSGSIQYILPELFVSALLILVIIIELIRKSQGHLIFTTIIGSGLFLSLFASTNQFALIGNQSYVDIFDEMLRIDKASVFFRSLFIIGGMMFLLMALNNRKLEEQKAEAEFYIVFLGILLGSCFLISSINLLSIYISIELISISSYIITVFDFNRKSLESGLKYLLFGALSSGIMLYGISLLYGFTGSLQITDPEFISALQLIPTPALILAFLFILSGLFFKMSIMPFHFWAPDVYEGAPVSIVAFFSVIPKLAGLVAFIRLYHVMQGLENVHWDLYFGWLAIITMTFGNLIAIWQNNAKRMMAYSSIAHSGLFLMGAIVSIKSGFDAIMFYSVVYLFMNFLVFFIIHMFHKGYNSFDISEYKGGAALFPFFSFAIAAGLISLTGLPPVAGFTGKLLIFSALWSKYQVSGGYIWSLMVLFGLVNSVVSLFYYLRIPYYLYFKGGDNISTPKPALLSMGIVVFMTLPLFIFFFKPDWLLELINTISFTF